MTDEVKRKMLHDNAARFYKITAAGAGRGAETQVAAAR